MTWSLYLAHFFAGFFLANGVPHFVNGISGRRFPSPFASPPGRGESRPVVNVLWGLANFTAGYFLLARIGPFRFAPSPDSLSLLLGMIFISITLAVHFGALPKK
jgi:hypothetical protein